MTVSAEATDKLSPIVSEIQTKLTHGQIEVPLLPEVAGKVMRLTQDPESDAIDLAKLIQSDQTLAGHVMRVANSAAYSPNATMVSLQQAITRLGMRVISEIALAASINSSLFNTPGYESYINYILNCSLACGLWCKETARACRKNVEAAFLSGLLNDIGRPVTVQVAIETSEQMGIELSKDDVLAIERRCKRDVGLKVLEIWEMPTMVRDVVEHFDDYEKPHNAKAQTMIVVAGTAIARHFFCDSKFEVCPTRKEVMGHSVFAGINLYKDELELLLEQDDNIRSTMGAMSA